MCYDLFPFLLIYFLFCLSLCTTPCLALFAFLCACFIAYLCVVLNHILHDTWMLTDLCPRCVILLISAYSFLLIPDLSRVDWRMVRVVLVDDNSWLHSRSFASKTRKTYRRKASSSGCKQRRVNILTKSSLRLPSSRTVVYIHRVSRDHERDIETDRMAENRSKANRTE